MVFDDVWMVLKCDVDWMNPFCCSCLFLFQDISEVLHQLSPTIHHIRKESIMSHPVWCPTSTGQLIPSVVGSARLISSQPFSTTICIAKVEHDQPMQSMFMTMHLRWSIDNHIQTIDHDWPSLMIIWLIHLTVWIVPVAIVSYYPWWRQVLRPGVLHLQALDAWGRCRPGCGDI